MVIVLASNVDDRRGIDLGSGQIKDYIRNTKE